MSHTLTLDNSVPTQSAALLSDAQRQNLAFVADEALGSVHSSGDQSSSKVRFSRPQAKGITVRRPNFNPKTIKRHYVRGQSALLSHFLTALSSTFPIGEQFFVHSVRNVRDRITDPTLSAQITAFIGQEAMHSLAHDQFNQNWRRDDYNLDSFVAWLASHDTRIKKVPAKYQLAVTVAFEHFTAVFGEYILRSPNLIQSFDDNTARLWLWHAIEESEHKSVAFDVYQTLYGDLKLRRQMMTTVAMSFMGIMARSTSSLFWQDRKASLPKVRDNLQDIWIVARMFVVLLPEFLEFYRKDFHPAKRDRTALLHTWRQRLDSGQALVV